MKQKSFKFVLYSLLLVSLLIPIITTSLPMKRLHVSSEATRSGISGDGNLAASTANTWTNKTNPSGDKPSPIVSHAMAYDSKNDRTILFGGIRSVGGSSNETWVYNYTDNTWTNMTTTITGDNPSPRTSPAMAYDSKNNRTILFGGFYAGARHDDTWVYNYTDNTWTNMNPSGDKPSARSRLDMVYDSTNDRVILFGGYRSVGGYSDETWVYNYTDNTWTNMNPSGDKPSPRECHTMVYDSTDDRTILFGGIATWIYDDTWVYNYTDNTWSNVTDPSGDKPSKRYLHSMVYDSTDDKTILFGGDDISNDFGDTWVYNYIDNTWTNMNPSGDKPSARSRHDMVYDSTNDRVILFGGDRSVGGLSDETWVYCFAESPSSQLPSGDDDDDDDEDTGALIVVVVIITLACVGGVVIVIIVLIKKGIIDTSKLKRG